MSKILFEFLQIAIGNRNSLSVAINDSDWLQLFNFCKSQDILGIGYTAVEKLHSRGIACPSSLEEQWRDIAYQIEKQNEVINGQCAVISRQYEHDGFSTCILNGQGNLSNYPEELKARRMSDDIFVWAIPNGDVPIAVQTGKGEVGYVTYHGCKAVIEYVKMLHRLARNNEKPVIRYHHIEAPKLDGTEVEVHFRVGFVNSPLRNFKMQRWFDAHADVCMKNKTQMGFAVPTSSVNVVYQMCHLFSHYFDEGLGLRQLMDYYFALKIWHNDVMECKDLQSQGMWSEGLGTPVMSATEIMAVLRSFGMGKFAGAVMWVLNEAFENEECSDADEVGEQQLPAIGQQLKEIGPQADSKGRQQEQHKTTFCPQADGRSEREFTRIKRELKEIGPQAEGVGEQQLTAIGQQLKEICPQSDDRSERELPQINRELKEIGPQADDRSERECPQIYSHIANIKKSSSSSASFREFKKNIFVPWMICEPNEKEGRKLMAEIMQGGNFGQYDTRDAALKKGGMMKHGVWKLKRVMRLVSSYPEEALWEPVFRVYHLVWRGING